MQVIKGFLINREKDVFREYDFEYNNYKDIYPLIGVKYFEVAERMFKGRPMSILCDEEGLLHNPVPPATILTFNEDGYHVETIVGNVFICKHNDEGDMVSLNKADIDAIKKSIMICKVGKVLEAEV